MPEVFPRRRHLLASALAVVMVATGCSEDPSSPGLNNDQVVARVVVTPVSFDLPAGRTTELRAQAFNAAGALLSARPMRWTSSAPHVAAVAGPQGVVSLVATVLGMGEGTATISAEADLATGSATATVTRALVSHVEIRPQTTELAVGQERDMEAVAFDGFGRQLDGRPATWETSDANIASVTPAGRLTGRALGWTTVSAMIEGVRGSGVVYLLPVPVNVTEIDLGTLGGSESVARGINRHGVVVGESKDATGMTRAFRWTTAGGIGDLGTLGGPISHAQAINDDGAVVGGSVKGNGILAAFLWTPAAGMRELALGSNLASSHATAINAAGDVAGSVTNAASQARAFLLRASSELHLIAPLFSFAHSTAAAVNSQRTVVGTSYNDYDFYYFSEARGFRWSDGSAAVEIDFDTFSATDVNEGGGIVGQTDQSLPFRWTPGTTPTFLTTFGLQSSGTANAITDAGVVAGHVVGAVPHAVIWLSSGERVLLSSAESEALAISESGWIVGWKRGAPDAPMRATLWKVAGLSQP